VNFTLARVLPSGYFLQNNAYMNASFGQVCVPVEDNDIANNNASVTTTLTLPSTPVNGSCGTASGVTLAWDATGWGSYSFCSTGVVNPDPVSLPPVS
jgi:hypothetical protein